MSAIKLEEPVLDELTKSTNFFNGRLLTATDLKTDQQANRQGRRRLGRAVGEGVVSGLEVTEVTASPGKAPVLEVSPGLALNRSGQTLALTSKARVELARQISDAPLDAGLFAECGAATSTTNLADGVYLFVV
ncbi:MAG TPA: hypothetical protein VGV38_17995, partial [Pyrinomonadaceae bacterium]|nr:hypothetical protein [Pyrinomonadaceae bacterium]